MTLPLFLRVFLLSSALSLVSYVLFPMPLPMLAKLLALSFAMSMLVPITYPHIRGVRRGDMVAVVNEAQRQILPLPIPFLNFGTHISLDDGRVGSRIRVSMPDGTWREAVVISYSSFLAPARVRLLQTADLSLSVL